MSTIAASASKVSQLPPIGELLRTWRKRRSMSQLDLALDADVSSRHVSFLETGRSRPSREMVLHLAEHLEVPLRERNGLLLAAGYAPLYEERALDSEEMQPVRVALERFLRAHDPFPALVLDRHYNLLTANDALAVLIDGVAADLLEPPANALRVTLHPLGMAPRIANLPEWSAHLLHRLRRQAAISGDGELERLYDELSAYPGVSTELPGDGPAATDILLPLRLVEGEQELAFFSTISTFGTPIDITLSELMIEAFYPANAATASRMLGTIGAEISFDVS